MIKDIEMKKSVCLINKDKSGIYYVTCVRGGEKSVMVGLL